MEVWKVEETHHNLLCEIHQAIKDIHGLLAGRPNIDKIELISANNAYVVDYKQRKHIFMWSANSLTLTLEDLGTQSISQNTWTNISFSPGMRIFAQGQNSQVPVLIRCTDATAQ